MTQPVESANKSCPKWVRALLFVSLAVNLLIVGAVTGAMMRHDPRERVRGAHYAPLRDLGYAPFSYALSPGDRREIGKSMRAREGDLKTNKAEVRQQFNTLLSLLRAKSYDADALLGIVEGQRAKLNERQVIGQQVLLERISAMTNREREAFARRLEKSLRRPLRRD